MMPINPLLMRTAAPSKTPNQVAGLTLWIDFSDSTYVFTDTACTTHVASDGDNIRGLINKAGIGVNFTYGGTRVTWKTNQQNGRAIGLCVDTGGITGSNFNVYATATDFLLIGVVKLHGVTTTSTIYTGYGIITNGFGGVSYSGMLYSAGSGGITYAYNWDGNGDYAAVTLAQDVYAIITIQHIGGNIRTRINGGAWTTVASGNTQLLTNPTYLAGGVNTGTGGDLYFAECAGYNVSVVDADITAVENGFRGRWATP